MLTTVTSRSLALVLIIPVGPVKVSCVTLTTGHVVDTFLLEWLTQSFKESGTTLMEIKYLFSLMDFGDVFFRTRGNNDGTLNLFRRGTDIASPIGSFCCEIPVADGVNRTLCANIGET